MIRSGERTGARGVTRSEWIVHRAACFAVSIGVALTGLAACCGEPSPTVAAWPASGAARGGATESSAGAGRAPGASESDAPTARMLLDAHAAELERLPTLVSGGIVQVTWRDEDGGHFEQGELDLRYRAPDDLSLRLSKLGETHFMGGCNATRWWWFDGWSKPTRLTVGRRHRTDGAGAPSSVSADRDAPPIEAHRLLALLGLRPLTTRAPGATEGDAAGATRAIYDLVALPTADGRWSVEIPATMSPLERPTRATFDRARAAGAVGWSLVALDVLDVDGAVMLSARYDDHRRIERRDLPPGAWPVVAARIALRIPPRGERRGFEWLIELDRPSGAGDRIVERLFDPEAIRASVRAESVEIDGVSGSGP